MRSTPERAHGTIKRRNKASSLPPESVILGLLGVNTAVFGAWMYARDRAQHGDAHPYAFMMRHFTSGEPQLLAGRWWTLLTSCFSHQDTMHWGCLLYTSPSPRDRG